MNLHEGGVFVLTGAGISAESGIPTFRDASGLWESHAIEDVASPEGFARDPWLVWRFYSQRRAGAAPCVPNTAHRALATAEVRLGERLLVFTQNVDHLHEAAGSTRLVHVHGELWKTRCSARRCLAPSVKDSRSYASLDDVPRCASCGALMRPDIVWFGEEPRGLDEAAKALDLCGTFVAVGTSGLVWPVAGFVDQLRRHRPEVRTVYVGPEPPNNARAFHELRLAKATEALPPLLAELTP
jgi:NAD-dependent deacetylase